MTDDGGAGNDGRRPARGMRVGIAGVPGTGKTTLARRIAQMHPEAAVVHLNEFADEHGLLGAADPLHHDAREVDLDALQDALDARTAPAAPAGHAAPDAPAAPSIEFWEGHFAHEMDVDAVVLLRCDPLVLIERLRARGWPESKVRENVEAEALDVVAAEVLASELPAVELDLTGLSVDEAARQVWTIAEDGPEASKAPTVGTARWSLEALPWF